MKYVHAMSDYSAILDSVRALRDCYCQSQEYTLRKACKATWERCFRVYPVNARIASELADENNFTWFPVYRGLDSEDDEFATRADALEAFKESIEASIADEIIGW